MITLDADEMIKLNNGLKRYRDVMPKSVAVNALKKSAEPMLKSAQRLVPVGKVIRTSGEYSRGGATRRDLRLKSVKVNGDEIARVIVGVSQKSGKVGWRTHFITRGFTAPSGRKIRGRDFLKDAHDYTIEIVKSNFYRYMFDGFIKWGKKNLPKGNV